MIRTHNLLFSFLIAASMAASADMVTVPSASKATGAPAGDTRLECDVTVNAPLEEVWKCWTTSEGAQTFLARKALIEPHPGGAFEIWFMPENPPGERGAEDLKVLSVLPGEMLSFEWSAPPQFAHARPQRTWVVIMFHAIDEARTHVRLVHLGWDEMNARNPDRAPEWDQVREYFSKAWPYVLNNLKRRFEEGPRWDENGKERWQS